MRDIGRNEMAMLTQIRKTLPGWTPGGTEGSINQTLTVTPELMIEYSKRLDEAESANAEARADGYRTGMAVRQAELERDAARPAIPAEVVELLEKWREHTSIKPECEAEYGQRAGIVQCTRELAAAIAKHGEAKPAIPAEVVEFLRSFLADDDDRDTKAEAWDSARADALGLLAKHSGEGEL